MCPICSGKLFQVNFGDEQLWWRCMDCDIVFQFHEYRYQNGELVRFSVWKRENHHKREALNNAGHE